MIGYPDRSDRPEHRRYNCAVARCAYEHFRVLARICAPTYFGDSAMVKDLGYLKTDLIYSIYYNGEVVKS